MSILTLLDEGGPASPTTGAHAHAAVAASVPVSIAQGRQTSAVAAAGLAARVPAYQQPIVARLYSRTSAGTLLATFAEPRHRGWQHRRNEPGTGSLEFDAADPAVASISRGDIIRFSLYGGERFAILVRPPRYQTVNAGEDAGRLVEIFGPGLLAALADAPVLPERGVGRRAPDRRVFNFSSADYDVSAAPWIDATEIKMQRINLAGEPYNAAPADWPLEGQDAWWIGSRPNAGSTPPQPVGRYYLVKDFTVAEEMDAALFFSVDDGAVGWLDNDKVFDERKAYLWAETRRVPMFLDAGPHRLAVEVENIDRPTAPATNISAFLATLHKMGSGGQTIGDVITQTDATWRALDYPASPPAFTPGRILRVLIEEVQAAGYLADLTIGWTDLADSNGAAWATMLDPTFEVGASLLDVVGVLVEQAIDVEMDHRRFRLHAYNKGTAGADRTASVVFAEGDGELVELSHDPVDLTANTLLARDADGVWTQTEDGASVAAYGRVATGVKLGTSSSSSGAEQTAAELLEEAAAVAYKALFALDPDEGHRPYADWNLHDLIAVPNRLGVATSTRVDALTIAETDDGEPTVAAEGWQQ